MSLYLKYSKCHDEDQDPIPLSISRLGTLPNGLKHMTNAGKEVLIVEDNEDNSILAEKILNYYGFKTVVTSNGKEAIQYCETHQPDLILMDLSLPDIDGMEVTRLLRKKQNYRHIPIIALTAHAMRGIQETTQEAGLNDFLTKPFLPNELISIVRKHLHE